MGPLGFQGGPWGVPWTPLGDHWGSLGVPWDLWGSLVMPGGTLGWSLGVPWGPLGSLWGSIGAPWRPFRTLWLVLQIVEKPFVFVVFLAMEAPLGDTWACLVCSLRLMGALWESLSVLGCSLRVLGHHCALLEMSLGSLGAPQNVENKLGSSSGAFAVGSAIKTYGFS